MKKISQTHLALLLSLSFTLFYNLSFYKNVLKIYPFNASNAFFLFSLVFVLFLATTLIILVSTFIVSLISKLVRIRFLNKIFLLLVLILSALSAFGMDSFGAVINDYVFLSLFKTNSNEVTDVFSFKLYIYVFLLFVIPALILLKIKISDDPFETDLRDRLKVSGIVLLAALILIFSQYDSYKYFFHKDNPPPYFSNPPYWMYSVGKLGMDQVIPAIKNMNKGNEKEVVTQIDDEQRKLVILILGESVRFDRFSINGFTRETNPQLKKEKIYSFTNVTSCGTTTAASVPCMLSPLGRKNFSPGKAYYAPNVMTIMALTKTIDLLWRENNSNTDDIPGNFKSEDFRSSALNTVCDVECRDEGMVVGLQGFIKNSKSKDIFIVLHPFGTHGPSYYRRYPSKFERFKPVCKTSALKNCSITEIENTYDNALLYTDYFLSLVVNVLKDNSKEFKTAMLYIGDHGESLGEKGQYIHGFPFDIAPKEQTHVPLFMWFGGKEKSDFNLKNIKTLLHKPYSHDNIFHTLLGLMGLRTPDYDPNLDILHPLRISEVKK